MPINDHMSLMCAGELCGILHSWLIEKIPVRSEIYVRSHILPPVMNGGQTSYTIPIWISTKLKQFWTF